MGCWKHWGSACHRSAFLTLGIFCYFLLGAGRADAQTSYFYQDYCMNPGRPFAGYFCNLGNYLCDIRNPMSEGYLWCTGTGAGPSRPFNWPTTSPWSISWGSLCCPRGQVATGACTVEAQRCVLSMSSPTPTPRPSTTTSDGGAVAVGGVVSARLLWDVLVALGFESRAYPNWAINLGYISELQVLCRTIRYESGTRCPALAPLLQTRCFEAFQAWYDGQGCPVATGDPIGYVPTTP